jgi:hypothetical protein
MPFGVWKDKKALIYLGYFPSAKKFNHIAKDANIFHFKLGGNRKLTTSQLPPLQDTPPISTTNLLQMVDFLYGKIWPTYYKRSILYIDRFWFLLSPNLTYCKFLFFFSLSFCTFLKSMVCLSMDLQTPWWIQLWVQSMKTTKGSRIRALLVTCNTLGVKGRVGALGWRLGQMTSKSIIHTDMHGLALTKQKIG